MRPRATLLLPALLISTLIACISDPVTGRSRGSVLQMSAKQERDLGRQLAPDVEAQFDAIVPDAHANQVLGDLVASMVDLSPRKDELDFEFKILNSSVPNAMALPGGHVYITRGLLEEIHSEAEFIGVMGHEFGHVDHRHATRVPWSSALLTVPVIPFAALHRWLPIGRRVTGAATSIVAAPATLVTLGFSRRQELEADQRGLTFATELGYDPRDFREVFNLFDRLEAEDGSGSKIGLLRTHPRNKDRIRAIDESLEKNHPDLDGRTFRQTSPEVAAIFQTFRERADAYLLYDEALAATTDGSTKDEQQHGRDLLDEALERVPSEPLFWILRGEFALDDDKGLAAAAAFHRANALYEAGSPGDGHWKPPFYLAMLALQREQPRSAQPLLETALERYPAHAFTHYLIGVAHEETGARDLAKAAYKQAIKLSPKGSEVSDSAKERLKDMG